MPYADVFVEFVRYPDADPWWMEKSDVNGRAKFECLFSYEAYDSLFGITQSREDIPLDWTVLIVQSDGYTRCRVNLATAMGLNRWPICPSTQTVD